MTPLPSELMNEIFALLGDEYVIFERDIKRAVLACADCGETWSIQIPSDSFALNKVIRRHGKCITCASKRVVRL